LKMIQQRIIKSEEYHVSWWIINMFSFLLFNYYYVFFYGQPFMYTCVKIMKNENFFIYLSSKSCVL
jgi:hypothetical protein